MEFKYPLILIAGIIIIATLFLVSFFYKKKAKEKYVEGKRKIANTKYMKSLPYYKKIKRMYKVMFFITRLTCALCILAAVIMLASPFEYKVKKEARYTKDIMLCMDISVSVDTLNNNLVKQFMGNTWNLDGEKFGITIFNTSSVLLVPLTDDYEYIDDTFESLSEGLSARQKYYRTYDIDLDGFDKMKFIEAGTLVGSDERGSSLIGDGFVSGVYNFPDNSDGKRTQIMILTTDNVVEGQELIDILSAAKVAKDRKIIVYGIAPVYSEGATDEDYEEFKKAVERTGGKYYEATDDKAVEKVLNDIKEIESTEMDVKDSYMDIKVFGPFILLLISVMLMTLSRKWVQR